MDGQVNIPNVSSANDMVQGNPMFVKQNPELAAAGIQSGSQEVFNTLAATSHVTAVANALDDHIATYNSSAWLRNALKDTPDIAVALIKTHMENLIDKAGQ
jgi:hypothetical protein